MPVNPKSLSLSRAGGPGGVGRCKKYRPVLSIYHELGPALGFDEAALLAQIFGTLLLLLLRAALFPPISPATKHFTKEDILPWLTTNIRTFW
jgi:hypothetical protein